ncbi:DUF3299 domain-containing protein [Cellvibrio sp. OA-2007]|uniref:DUF3299 domain-containing protein n=1 Tax=Cellvibrio sp. OA-2007 TaxID=529823 RepID=UPI001EE6CF2B|nr:DUF3299 domain-containing protein [Cellvibrio sp. OA-2007]
MLESIPQVDHESLSEDELAQDLPADSFNADTSAFENQIANAIAESKQMLADEKKSSRDWRDALKSTNVRPEFNNKRIRIAGYIVPIEYDEKQIITEFFLVPYFGACIHVPPPPPNQLIYVKHPKGFQLPDLYTPFWVEGTLALETQENELGLSSYSMRNVKLTRYEEPEEPEFLNKRPITSALRDAAILLISPDFNAHVLVSIRGKDRAMFSNNPVPAIPPLR